MSRSHALHVRTPFGGFQGSTIAYRTGVQRVYKAFLDKDPAELRTIEEEHREEVASLPSGREQDERLGRADAAYAARLMIEAKEFSSETIRKKADETNPGTLEGKVYRFLRNELDRNMRGGPLSIPSAQLRRPY